MKKLSEHNISIIEIEKMSRKSEVLCDKCGNENKLSLQELNAQLLETLKEAHEYLSRSRPYDDSELGYGICLQLHIKNIIENAERNGK